MKEDEYLIKNLIIECKKAMTRNWYQTFAPSIQQGLNIVKEIYMME